MPFRNVFTLPHELNPIIRCNKKIMLGILFKAVSETLLQFGENPNNRLNGRLGIIMILHTWDQKLNDHFHMHCLVPGGALSFDRKRFVHCKNKFLFSEKAPSKVFRGKFMEFMEKVNKDGQLHFPGDTGLYGTEKMFRKLFLKLYTKDWVIKIKEPIEKPEYVLDYLGRYTHRVAISNNRILGLKNGEVTFAVKNRKTNKNEKVTLAAVEFIRRFLLHTLPKGFMRIRHYGFLANRCKKDCISKCRELLGCIPELPEVFKRSVQELMLLLTDRDITKCPCCQKGTMKIIEKVPKRTGTSAFDIIHPPELMDTA